MKTITKLALVSMLTPFMAFGMEKSREIGGYSIDYRGYAQIFSSILKKDVYVPQSVVETIIAIDSEMQELRKISPEKLKWSWNSAKETAMTYIALSKMREHLILNSQSIPAAKL